MTPSRWSSGLLVAACSVLSGCGTPGQPLIVIVPVADVRSQPGTAARSHEHDPEQETQVLYGEQVLLRRAQDGWMQIEALEQQEFTHKNRWQGYPGWVQERALKPPPWHARPPSIVVTEKWAPYWADAFQSQMAGWLPMGSQLFAVDIGGQLWQVEVADGSTGWLSRRHARPLFELERLPAQQRRLTIVHAAEQFIGDPYFWGGRSPHSRIETDRITGVDCSGLVNLSYRAAGITIPRDAHEQWMRARPVKTLEPADLIFLSERDNPRRIVHVMLFAGSGEVIEAPGTGERVRRIALMQRLGQPLTDVHPGAVINGQTVYFGSHLETSQQRSR
ncbi:MAG: hypothetical protein COV75_05170 [Candidatus Omnitrophica bacterium CG11_big_fil_rev_8_21_14_0_20_63_9]|nr:MAG: hypothetical protein COV75_05170 [Candidatus Omnitrophica bacterium CG11_big_fil_rev_8_21_14_0_20_63_9]